MYWFALGAWSMVTVPAGLASALGHRSADTTFALGMVAGLLIYALIVVDRVCLDRARARR